MIIAPLNTNLISPTLETSAPSFQDALSAQKSKARGTPQIGDLEPYVKTFEANYPGFNATFEKAQLYAVCMFATRLGQYYEPSALALYKKLMRDDNNNVKTAIKKLIDNLARINDPWTGISVDDRRGYVNDAYHTILSNEIAQDYKKNFDEMLDSLSRLSAPTPEQAAGIYLKYGNFLNEFYHIAEYYQPLYMDKYEKFNMLINNYSEAHNTTRNYSTRQLLSDFTTNRHQTIRASGGIWGIGGGPNVDIKMDESVTFFSGGQTVYSRARAVARILQSDGWLSNKIGVTYSFIDLKNAYELLGISDRQIEMYAKSAAIGNVGAGYGRPRTAEGEAAFKMLKAAIGMRTYLFGRPPASSAMKGNPGANVSGALAAFKAGIKTSGAFWLPSVAILAISGGVQTELTAFADISYHDSLFGKVFFTPYVDNNKQNDLGKKMLAETVLLLSGRP
ncbi:MAG: hypothetical protein JWM36_4400 [Hyphomicrobiales bacterium]|nr:hypothetical protein [Hyphomicrobiales bacterium]